MLKALDSLVILANCANDLDHDLRNLPESPGFPELLTFLLQGNDNLEVILDAFFDNISNLRVLDPSRTRIKYLSLNSLRELFLLDCGSSC